LPFDKLSHSAALLVETNRQLDALGLFVERGSGCRSSALRRHFLYVVPPDALTTIDIEAHRA
jgi:hypothetical protein